MYLIYYVRFSPGLKAQIYIGEKEPREQLAREIKRNVKKGNNSIDVLLTTYEVNWLVQIEMFDYFPRSNV